MILAVLGPPFTYTDLASSFHCAKNFFKNSHAAKSFLKKYYSTVREVIEAVRKGHANFGVIPIENNTYGTVRETEDYLFLYHPQIIHAFTMAIHHAFIAQKGVKIKEIKTIISHQQSFEQCSYFLQKYFPSAEKIIVGSTAKAIEQVAESKEKTLAAVGPALAAHKKKCTVLKKNIENDPNNKTTFIIIQYARSKGERVGLNKHKRSKIPKNTRTSIVFWFSKNKAGSLYQVLGLFAEAKVNLTKIESRPAPHRMGEYLFFLDFEGHKKDSKIQKILKKLSRIVAGFKSFGSYEMKE